MDNLPINPSTQQVGRLLINIKSASVFLGILYGISFLLLLPIFMYKYGNILSVGLLLFISVLSIFLVHLLLNITYYLIIAAPLIMAGVLFFTGFTIWLFSPLFVGVLVSISSIISFFLLDLSGYALYLTEFMTRLGQTFMAGGSAIWWGIKKVKDFNLKALTVYLIFLGILGVLSGLISYTYTLIFLFIWGVVYLKVNGEDNPLGDMTKLFKIVATIAIIFGVFKIQISLGADKSIVNTKLFFTKTSFWESAGYKSFVRFYGYLIGGAALTGIWKPQILKKLVPPHWEEKVLNYCSRLIGEAQKVFFIK